MKSKACFAVLLYLFFAVAGSLYSIGEKTIRLGGDAIRRIADYNAGISEVSRLRPAPVLVLASESGSLAENVPSDLALSFDEGSPALFADTSGHYRLSVAPSLSAVDSRYARAGSGAVLFSVSKTGVQGTLTIEARNSGALFTPNNRIYDFAIEFWLHPLNMENGEEILLWSSSLPAQSAVHYASQEMVCVSSKNRLQWSFLNFFASPDGARKLDLNIGGVSAVVPKTWSHHLIRFDSDTGMLEYLINGKTESIEYATSTGHEGGEVYTPVTGEGGNFVLGRSFSGLIDEFEIHGGRVPGTALRKYPASGGRIETKAIDLGDGSNGLLKLEAAGGTTNEYQKNGLFRFANDSEMQFFLRCSDNPYRWDGPWQTVTPGDDITGTAKGRYVQLAVDFYPSADGEASPYLEELRITYLPDEPPMPPAQLTAIAVDGGVQLRWKNSPSRNARGYLVYYGTASDNYFCEDSSRGVSPIDAGKQNSLFIDGLQNGTLYYFRVAAYNGESPPASRPGEFSREVRARPLKN